LCFPGRSLGGLKGEAQRENWPLSSLHWKVAAGSVEVNLNLGRAFRVFFGPFVIVVSGAAGGFGVCTENERVATEEFPAWSVAWARKV
jgi:hypothetical protein